MIRKGIIRNVELRTQTVQEVLLTALDPKNSDSPERTTYNAGFNWGLGWAQDFVAIQAGTGCSSDQPLKDSLEDWAYYDATAGMERIEFICDQSGLPCTITVKNFFLGIERDEVDLRMMFTGYLAGSLTALTAGQSFDAIVVELSNKTIDRDTYKVTYT